MRMIATALTLALAAPAAAQDLPELVPGTRVRLTAGNTPGHRVAGTVQAADQNKLTIISDERLLVVPRDQLTRLEVGWGRKSNWLKGLLIGAALGALAFSSGDTCDLASPGEECPTRAAAMAIGAGTMGGLGAGIGAFVKSDTWREVPARGPSAAASPSGSGVGLALSIRF